jgi:hypothetical protein
MNMRTKLAITAGLVIIMAAASVGIIQTAMAKGTPYQDGYDIIMKVQWMFSLVCI